MHLRAYHEFKVFYTHQNTLALTKMFVYKKNLCVKKCLSVLCTPEYVRFLVCVVGVRYMHTQVVCIVGVSLPVLCG